MVEATNKVTVSGTVIMINSGRNITTVQIVSDGGNGKKAYPRFVFRDLIKTAGFRVGDRVTITGHIHNWIRRNAEREIIGRNQELIGDEIELTHRMLLDYFDFENGLEGEGGYPPDMNKALIAGNVTHIYSPRPDITIITVVVNDGNHINYCEVTCFLRQSETAQLLEENDMIAAVGHIQTSIKEKNGERAYYQSMTARDIAKIQV